MQPRVARLTAAFTQPGSRVPNALSAVLVVVLAAVAWHNAFTYPSVSGFDAEPAIAYAQTLVEDWRIPTELKNYYTPPGFFLLSGAMLKLGEALGVDEPAHMGQLLNGILTVATALLLAVLCSIVFPGRAWLRFGAVAFFVSCPIVLKTGAMFHPQPLVAFFATLALVLAARMLKNRRYGVGAALTLGLVVGMGQLVRSVGLWTLGVVGIALFVAAVVRVGERRQALRSFAIVVAVGLLVALPWYAYMHSRYSNPIFGRSSAPAAVSERVVPGVWAAPALLSVAASSAPAYPSQHLWFFADPGLPEIVTAPHRARLAPAFWPILYTETWGDYFGVWAWGSVQKPMSSPIERRLVVQSIVGILPTFLALAGLVALAALAIAGIRARIELALAPLMALVAFAGTLYYARSYGSTDGDTVKALFLLPALPAFAVCFGFAVDVIRVRSPRVALVLAVPLALAGIASFAFGIA